MACFLVPVTEAIVTTAATKVMEKKEEQQMDRVIEKESITTPFSAKMKWLNSMLWGGSALLCFEHIWHGEISAAFPFLTGATDAAGIAQILHEMGTVGVSMSVMVTLVWAAMVAFANHMEKKSIEQLQPVKERIER